MKASEIKPLAWRYGNSGPLGLRRFSLMRKWNAIQRKVERMEANLLLLMANPDTTPEQLQQVAEAYANTTKLLHEYAVKIDESIHNEDKPKEQA
jgi:hypothetical protein